MYVIRKYFPIFNPIKKRKYRFLGKYYFTTFIKRYVGVKLSPFLMCHNVVTMQWLRKTLLFVKYVHVKNRYQGLDRPCNWR